MTGAVGITVQARRVLRATAQAWQLPTPQRVRGLQLSAGQRGLAQRNGVQAPAPTRACRLHPPCWG